MKKCNLCVEFEDNGFVRIPIPKSITRFLMKEAEDEGKPVDIYIEVFEEEY